MRNPGRIPPPRKGERGGERKKKGETGKMGVCGVESVRDYKQREMEQYKDAHLKASLLPTRL